MVSVDLVARAEIDKAIAVVWDAVPPPLLWQIYSGCFSSLIQDRQYGHR